MSMGLSNVSFTPGFSPVLEKKYQQKTVSTVFLLSLWKRLKPFLNNVSLFHRAEARCE